MSEAEIITSPKENNGGLAFSVILEPPKKDSPCLTPRSRSRAEVADIKERHQQAQARREAMEAERLQLISRNRGRAQEAIDRLRASEEKLRQAAQEKLDKRSAIEENREQQMEMMRERLRLHLKHVEEVCQRSSVVSSDLGERIKRKYESAEEKRRMQIDGLLEKLREHAKHVEEVCRSSENDTVTKVQQEKCMERLESVLKKRQDNIQALQERLQEHEKHIQDVRKNKLAGENSFAGGDNMNNAL